MGSLRVKRQRLGTIEVSSELVEKVRLLLEDPMRPGKLKYGALNDYLERLIKQDLEAKAKDADSLIGGLLDE